jgi:ABC-2 type transport system ATP-binding protein
MVNGWDLGKVEHPGDLKIGYLPEEPRFYPWLTGRETLSYLGTRWEKGSVKKRVDEMLHWVGLKQAANRRVGGYSRGMKQRLGMAAALLYDPELLLLDEPSSALDPEGRSDVLNLIMDLKSRGKTVFLSTHILSDVEKVCDRVGILSHGHMVVEKSLEDLFMENVKSIYDVALERNYEGHLIDKIKILFKQGHIEISRPC